MDFVIRNLSVLAHAHGFTLWHYKTSKDTIAQVSAANYMSYAADILTAGDLIVINAADGACIRVVAVADVETAILAPLS